MATEEVVPGLTVELLPEINAAVFTVVGSVPLSGVSQAVELGIQALAGRPRHVVVDFSRAKEIRTVGVGLLGYFQGYLRKRGYMMAVVRPRAEGALADLPGYLSDQFPVFETREEALSAVAGEG